jgi:RimJ/RimL family protein N-acetyltransferase
MNAVSARQLTPDEWAAYRDIRLEALRMHPAFFSPSRDETAFLESDWRERLANPNAATFALFDGVQIVATAGIFREGNDPASARAFLVGTYVKPDYRRKGLSELLFTTRIAWAKEQRGVKTLLLENRGDNLPIQKAHQKFGFRQTGTRDQLWPDGTHAPCFIYELNI